MTFDEMNLPEYAKSFTEHAIWTISVIRYTAEEKNIYCNILDYRNGEGNFNYRQLQLSDVLKNIKVEALPVSIREL